MFTSASKNLEIEMVCSKKNTHRFEIDETCFSCNSSLPVKTVSLNSKFRDDEDDENI